VSPSSVLIVSDDTEFARTIAARWQSERHVPEITLVTSDVWHSASLLGYHLVIVGPVRDACGHHERRNAILAAVSVAPGLAVVYAAGEQRDDPALTDRYPQLLVLPRQDGWVGTLILISIEALRRVEAVERAQRAERQALASERYATLGRYMLEMRPSLNNALTSVVGNADLLLLEPGQACGQSREQIQTIHTMALRLNEIVQRFSSLASEMRAGEKESQAETETVLGGRRVRP
jgi:signal transduction histidine kinase